MKYGYEPGRSRIRGGAWLSALVGLLVLLVGGVPPSAAAQDLPIVETHRIRLANQQSGAVEVSVDAGRSWQKIGQITRPASVSAVGGKALQLTQIRVVSVPSSVATPMSTE